MSSFSKGFLSIFNSGFLGFFLGYMIAMTAIFLVGTILVWFIIAVIYRLGIWMNTSNTKGR